MLHKQRLFKSHKTTFFHAGSKFTAKTVERYFTQFLIWQREDNQKYFCDLWINNAFDTVEEVRLFLNSK